MERGWSSITIVMPSLKTIACKYHDKNRCKCQNYYYQIVISNHIRSKLPTRADKIT